MSERPRLTVEADGGGVLRVRVFAEPAQRQEAMALLQRVMLTLPAFDEAARAGAAVAPAAEDR